MASPPTDGRHPDIGDVTRDADGGPDRIPKEHAAARAIQDRIKLLLLYETFLIYGRRTLLVHTPACSAPRAERRARRVHRHRSDGAARARANAAWSRLRRNDGAGARPRSQRQQEPKSAPEAIVAGPRRGRAHSRRGAALRARASRRVRLLGGPAARSHPPYVCTPTATRRPSPTANDYCSQIRDCQWPLPSVSLSSLSTASQRPTEVLWSNWPELGS